MEIPEKILEIAGSLEFSRVDGQDYRFECPICGSSDNLKIRWYENYNREVISCWSGCHKPNPNADPPYRGYPELVDAIRSHGGVVPKRLNRPAWDYVCSDGKTFQIVRLKDGTKRFRHHDPTDSDAKKDGTVWNAGTKERPLYRYYQKKSGEVVPGETQIAIQAGEVIRFVDGESDAEAFRKWGLIATTNPGGGSNFTDDHAKALSGATVQLYMDLDDKGSGYKHAWERYEKLIAAGCTVTLWRPPDPKDVRDHLEKHGKSPDDFIEVTPEELKQWAYPKKTVGVAGSPELDSLSTALEAAIGLDQLNPRDIAKILHAQLAGMKHLAKSGEWRRWNGYSYEECEAELRAQIIPATVEVSRNRLMAEVAEAGGTGALAGLLRKREYSFSRGAFPRELIALLSDFCWVEDEEFDSDSTIFACESGVLDREAAKPADGDTRGRIEWLPHDSMRLITKCISFVHDPEAKCPEWEAFLKSSIPDGGARLRMLVGFALCGDDTKKKRIVNLIGPSDTGKSTCLDILSRIIGCYLGTMRTDELTVSRNNAKFDFHGLRNSRLVFLSEPEPRSRFRVADLKRITGGEEMTTEGKGTKQVRWRASVMPFIGTNFHINFDTTDEAFERRLEYIEFKRTREIDRQLRKKLEAELPGIFNWMLQGVLDYFAGGLADTEESLAARRRAESAVEPPLQFVEYGLAQGYIHEVPDDFPFYKCCAVGKLYSEFCDWWHDDNPDTKPYGRKRFSSVIQKRYATSDKGEVGGGRIVFKGIAPGPQ